MEPAPLTLISQRVRMFRLPMSMTQHPRVEFALRNRERYQDEYD